MSRSIPYILVQVIVILATFFSTFFIVQAQEDLYGPSFLNVDPEQRTVRWSARANAIGYVVAWGPCQKDEVCPWFYDDNPADGGASTARVSASGSEYYTYTLPSLSGWYGVSVHPLGDGVNYHEYSGFHGTRRLFGSSGYSNSGTTGEFFPLGAIGKTYRVSDTQIDFYEIIEGTTQGVLALRITQAEIDVALEAAGEATCVKASANDRASVTVWADGNVTFSIGPDYETKIFHVLLEGGLDGSIIGHSTTYGPPAGAHCAN